MPPLLTIPASVVRREAGSLPTASESDRPGRPAPTLSDVRVAITGSHGLIGTALVARLGGLGHDVVRIVRSSAGRR